MTDVEATDLDASGRRELPISRTNLDSHSNVSSVGRNAQIMSDADGKAEASPFTLDCESVR